MADKPKKVLGPGAEASIEQNKKVAEEEAAERVKHVGGGVYETPDGERVKGKDAAVEAAKENADG